MTACPDDAVLIELIEDTLGQRELAALQRHVDDCASCRRVIASLIAMAASQARASS